MIMLVWLKQYNIQRLKEVTGMSWQGKEHDLMGYSEGKQFEKEVTAMIIAEQQPPVALSLWPYEALEMLDRFRS